MKSITSGSGSLKDLLMNLSKFYLINKTREVDTSKPHVTAKDGKLVLKIKPNV